MPKFRYFTECEHVDGKLHDKRWLVCDPESLCTVQFVYSFAVFDTSIGPRAIDLGFHSPVPVYKGQTPMEQPCKWTGNNPCYYDGTSLGAEDFANEHREFNDQQIFKSLERHWQSIFSDDIVNTAMAKLAALKRPEPEEGGDDSNNKNKEA